MMREQIELVGGADPVEVALNEYAAATSLVITPMAGATISVEYSCTPQNKKYTPVWIAATTLTDITEQTDKEFGPISRLRFTIDATGSGIFDIIQSN
jgi:hypothetical protein